MSKKQSAKCIPVENIFKIVGLGILFILCLAILNKFPSTRWIGLVIGILYLGYIVIQFRKPCNLPAEEIDFEEIAYTLWLATEEDNIKETIKRQEASSEERAADIEDVQFKTQAAKDFWGVISGKRGVFAPLSAVYLKIAHSILVYLDTNFDLPSVSSNFISDPENDEYGGAANQFMLLREINILEHTLNVAQSMCDIVSTKLSPDRAAMSIGPLLLCALGHDLGKIIRQTELAESTLNHTHYSVEKMTSILDAFNIEARVKKAIIEAIQQHHTIPSDTSPLYCRLLREADKAARSIELAKLPTTPEGSTTITHAPTQTTQTAQVNKPQQKTEPKSSSDRDLRLYKDICAELWSAFAGSVASKKKEIYYYNGVCYFAKNFFDQTIADFFENRGQGTIYKTKPFSISADDNNEMTIEILRKHKVLEHAETGYQFSLIKVCFKQRWTPSPIPVVAVSAKAIAGDIDIVRETIKQSPSLMTISKITLYKGEDNEDVN